MGQTVMSWKDVAGTLSVQHRGGYSCAHSMGNGQPCELLCKTKEVAHTLNHLSQVPMVIKYKTN